MLESIPPANPPAQRNPWQALFLLRDYFQARADRGQARVALSPPALQALRQIVTVKRPATTSSPPIVVTAPTASVAPAPPSAPVEIVRPAPLPEAERTARLAELRAAAGTHAPALALGTLRDIMVFAVGNPMARVMFVGEAPGTEEELAREPFVGPAGQTLTKMLKAMGLERSDVYITNICKFRPSMPNQGTSNRKPEPREMAACVQFVQEEIAVIQPAVIVALGATAAEGLLGLSNVAVGRVRSRFHDYQGTPVMITYHPSYLLHNNAMSERRKVWEDLMQVMEKMALPISEKQRGFFLPKPKSQS